MKQFFYFLKCFHIISNMYVLSFEIHDLKIETKETKTKAVHTCFEKTKELV